MVCQARMWCVRAGGTHDQSTPLYPTIDRCQLRILLRAEPPGDYFFISSSLVRSLEVTDSHIPVMLSVVPLSSLFVGPSEGTDRPIIMFLSNALIWAYAHLCVLSTGRDNDYKISRFVHLLPTGFWTVFLTRRLFINGHVP